MLRWTIAAVLLVAHLMFVLPLSPAQAAPGPCGDAASSVEVCAAPGVASGQAGSSKQQIDRKPCLTCVMLAALEVPQPPVMVQTHLTEVTPALWHSTEPPPPKRPPRASLS